MYLAEARFGLLLLWPFHLESFVPRALKAGVLCVQDFSLLGWGGSKTISTQDWFALSVHSSVRSGPIARLLYRF